MIKRKMVIGTVLAVVLSGFIFYVQAEESQNEQFLKKMVFIAQDDLMEGPGFRPRMVFPVKKRSASPQ